MGFRLIFDKFYEYFKAQQLITEMLLIAENSFAALEMLELKFSFKVFQASV